LNFSSLGYNPMQKFKLKVSQIGVSAWSFHNYKIFWPISNLYIQQFFPFQKFVSWILDNIIYKTSVYKFSFFIRYNFFYKSISCIMFLWVILLIMKISNFIVLSKFKRN
jgi:hypothetical protein